jgi:hypothetical protein
MRKINGWYGLALHALTDLMRHWQPNMTQAGLDKIVARLCMVSRRLTKRHWVDDGVADLDARRTKRPRLQGPKRARDQEDERPLKRLKQQGVDLRKMSHGSKRGREGEIEPESRTKRYRVTEPVFIAVY